MTLIPGGGAGCCVSTSGGGVMGRFTGSGSSMRVRILVLVRDNGCPISFLYEE